MEQSSTMSDCLDRKKILLISNLNLPCHTWRPFPLALLLQAQWMTSSHLTTTFFRVSHIIFSVGKGATQQVWLGWSNSQVNGPHEDWTHNFSVKLIDYCSWGHSYRRRWGSPLSLLFFALNNHSSLIRHVFWTFPLLPFTGHTPVSPCPFWSWRARSELKCGLTSGDYRLMFTSLDLPARAFTKGKLPLPLGHWAHSQLMLS